MLRTACETEIVPELVGSALVDAVHPALVDVDQEHQVVPEHAQPVQCGHLHAQYMVTQPHQGLLDMLHG